MRLIQRAAFVLFVCSSAGLAVAQRKPSITSPLFPGAVTIYGTAQVPAAGTAVKIYVCLTQMARETPDCTSKPLKLSDGTNHVNADANGNFLATLQTPLGSRDVVSVTQETVDVAGKQTLLFSLVQPVNTLPECISNALSGYKGSNSCVVHLDRNNLATPQPITVPKGTRVLLEIDNPHWNETLQFNRATTQNASPDLAADVLNKIMTNLQSLVLSQSIHIADVPALDPIENTENKISVSLMTAAIALNSHNSELSCFETYHVTVMPKDAGKTPQCSTSYLIGPFLFAAPADTFTAAQTKLEGDLTNDTGKNLVLQSDSIGSLAKTISDRKTQCASRNPPPAPAKCDEPSIDQFQAMADLFKTDLAALQKTQQTFLTDLAVIKNWAGVLAQDGQRATTIAWSISQTSNRTTVVTVAATEVISGTNTNFPQVSITWISQPFVLSTGILLSSLPNRSYAISQLVIDGTPVADPTNPGKYLTFINQTVTHPTISFPEVLGSWRIGPLSNRSWETKCPNHCAFLLSGGIGLNISQKSADFSGGVSFQLGSVLFTPLAHFSRESLLIDGLYPGEILGSNPPSALQTQNAWTVHYGLALTIVVPTP